MNRPPIPDPPHRGGCLCGAVRYSYDARPLALNACHCSDCKKLSGGGYSCVVLGDRSAFSHTGEVARWRKLAQSGREIDIVRCAACGVRLWHEPVQAPHFVFIQAGTLDDETWFVPSSHIWVSRASATAAFAPDALKVDGQPSDRVITIEAFNRIYS
jgi:hypothetical protein